MCVTLVHAIKCVYICTQTGREPCVRVIVYVCGGFFERGIFYLSYTNVIRSHCHLVVWDGC